MSSIASVVALFKAMSVIGIMKPTVVTTLIAESFVETVKIM